MRIPRRVVAVTATAAVAAGVAFTVDAVVASRIESDISARIASDAEGARLPAVTVGGVAGSRWSGPDTLGSVSVRVEGVRRPGLDPVSVEADATDLHLPTDRADPMTARSMTVSTLITGSSLGPALQMRDVLVAAADDPSLAGGTEHRARISGTLEGTDTRVSAFVDLVVDERGAHLVPVAPATGPAGVADQDPELALRRTALTLDPDLLPLGVDVDTLTVRGGTITAAGEADPGTSPLDHLARPRSPGPLDSPA